MTQTAGLTLKNYDPSTMKPCWYGRIGIAEQKLKAFPGMVYELVHIEAVLSIIDRENTGLKGRAIKSKEEAFYKNSPYYGSSKQEDWCSKYTFYEKVAERLRTEVQEVSEALAELTEEELDWLWLKYEIMLPEQRIAELTGYGRTKVRSKIENVVEKVAKELYTYTYER